MKKKEESKEIEEEDLEEILEEGDSIETVSDKFKFSFPQEMQIEEVSPVLNEGLAQKQTVTQTIANWRLEQTAEEGSLTSEKKENDFEYETNTTENTEPNYFQQKDNESVRYMGGRVTSEVSSHIDTAKIGREISTGPTMRNVATVTSMPQMNSQSDYENVRSAERIDTNQLGRENPFEREVVKYKERPHY